MAERVTFNGSTGAVLAGVIEGPVGSVRGWGLFAHGFTLGKDSPAATRVCKQLAGEGIGMLRFDNLGLGDSEGDWGDGSFTTKVADTIRAAEFMSDRGTPISLLVGHSLGGAAAIAAVQSTTARALITLAAPVDPRTVERHYKEVVQQAIADGSAPWDVGGKALTIKRQFVEDVRRADLGPALERLNVPLLIIHSPDDQTVPLADAGRIFRAVTHHPRSFISIEGADHLLATPGMARRVGRIISAWADPYLLPPHT
jgi:pimeloyl-ACP methyl ester carboxylesterase